MDSHPYSYITSIFTLGAPHDPLIDLKKKTGVKGYAQISDCYVIYLICYSIAGHSLGGMIYLKT